MVHREVLARAVKNDGVRSTFFNLLASTNGRANGTGECVTEALFEALCKCQSKELGKAAGRCSVLLQLTKE